MRQIIALVMLFFTTKVFAEPITISGYSFLDAEQSVTFDERDPLNENTLSPRVSVIASNCIRAFSNEGTFDGNYHFIVYCEISDMATVGFSRIDPHVAALYRKEVIEGDRSKLKSGLYNTTVYIDCGITETCAVPPNDIAKFLLEKQRIASYRVMPPLEFETAVDERFYDVMNNFKYDNGAVELIGLYGDIGVIDFNGSFYLFNGEYDPNKKNEGGFKF